MIKVISFDFYGVMYSNFDWGVINKRIYNDGLKYHEFQGLVREANNGLIDNDRFRMRVSRLADDEKHPDAPAVLIEPKLNIELLDYTKELAQNPQLDLAILSNGGKMHIERVLKDHDGLDHFKLIATSVELPCYKPEAAAFEYVMDHFGVTREEYIHIDDSPRHVAGAKRAGVKALLYGDVVTIKLDIEETLNSNN